MQFYAEGDSVTFLLETEDESGNMVNVDSASVVIRKSQSVAERDWANGVSALLTQSLTNFATGVYRYNWSTVNVHSGKYVAEVTVIRGGVTNKERILVELT